MIAGIDVSKWQGKSVDWSAVRRAGNSFAYCKASEGVGYRDRTFERNWQAAREAGLLVGAYHFARVSKSPNIESDARNEADWFSEVTAGMSECLPPVLDIEWDKRAKGIEPQEVVEWCVKFLARLETNTHRLPIVYTGRNFWRWKLNKTMGLTRYPLWLVQYGNGSGPAKKIPGWPYTFWQWSHTLPIAGIPGNVDRNWFKGSLDALKLLTMPISPPYPTESISLRRSALSTAVSKVIESYVGIAWRSESSSNSQEFWV